MKENKFMQRLKKALPHVVAIIIFMSIAAMFFAPQYEGKALRQGDMVQVYGMGRDIVLHKEAYDEHPQWAGNMFSGMPAYLIDMNYDGRYVKELAGYMYFLGQPAAFLFLAMAGFYLMLLMFGINPWLAIIGGVGYGLSSYFPIIIEAGHITKMMAMCWIAPLIGSIYYAYRGRRLLGVLLAGIFASIEISTSHPQITYYFLFAIIGLLIVEIVRTAKEKSWRRFWITTAALFGAAVLAIGSNFVQLYYVAGYTGDTIRGASELTATSTSTKGGLDKDYATAWSYGKGETFNMFIPNLMGGASTGGFSNDGAVASALRKYQARDLAQQLPGYWGDQPFTSGPVYLGAVIVYLFVLGLFVIRGWRLWWTLGVMAISLMLAWGNNMMWFSELFLNYFPLYNKFRTVSMILVLVQWAVPMLGIFALNDIVSGRVDKQKARKGIIGALGITGGFALIVAFVMPGMLDFSSAQDMKMGLPDDIIEAMRVERADLMSADALRSFGFVVAAAGILWCWLMGWIKELVLALGLGVLVTLDLYQVDRRYVKIENFRPQRTANAIEMTPANREILKDTTNYRVANFTVGTFNDATTSYFHRSVGGYHAAKLRRYQDLIDYHLARRNMAVYSMLNTKYFITENGVIENPDALGNAWFVDRVELVENPNKEIEAMEAEDWDPRIVAFVDQRFEDQISLRDRQMRVVDQADYISLDQYRVNYLKYTANTSEPRVALFSEIYYNKGWKVFLDGVEVPYFRADYVLRGMNIPEGEHIIEWRFESPNFALVVWITRICSLILIVGLVWVIITIIFQKVKDRRKVQQVVQQ